VWEEPNCCLIPDFTFLSSKLVQTSNSVNHCNQFNILNWNLWKTVYHLLMRQQNAKRWHKKCSDEKSERHKKIITVVHIQTHCDTKCACKHTLLRKCSFYARVTIKTHFEFIQCDKVSISSIFYTHIFCMKVLRTAFL